MRYLVILSLLWVAISASPAHALETPPNVRWQRNVTAPADTNTTTRLTDCKLLSNGNLAITGQFTGTGPILGSPYDSASQPTNGLFVAVQSASGDLLWLHRFAGLGCAPRLGIDQADNIHLIGLTVTEINLLGTTLNVEPDSTLIYQLCLQEDGTLGHLRGLGKMTGAEPYHNFPSLGTLCMPLTDGCLISLVFQRSIQINGISYNAEEEATGMLWLKLDQQNETAWAHCFSTIYNGYSSSLTKSPTGGYLGFAYLLPEGKFDGRLYSVPEDLRDSVMVWLDEGGQVTKTARLHGVANPVFTGVEFASDGDLFVTMVGQYDGVIETSGDEPLEISFGPPHHEYGANLIIARIAGDLSAIRWQKATEATEAYSIGMGLSSGQDDSLYVAIQNNPPLILDEPVFKGGPPTYPPYQTALVKVALDGQLKWVRFDKSSYPQAFAVAPDGTAYLAETSLISYSPSLTSSPPEFHIIPLTNHIAAAGSTLYFAPHVNGAADTVYYWYKDSVLLTNSTVSSLAISNLSSADLGSYTITASNQFGMASAGPFTFTLGPPSLLSRVETLGAINATMQFRPDAKFSPDGSKQVVVGATERPLLHGTNYYDINYPFSTFCLTIGSAGESNFFLASPSMTGVTPHAAIASDGSTFIVNRGTNNGVPCGWIVRYDPFGNEIWAKTIKSTYGDSDITLHKETALCVATSCEAGATFGSTTLAQQGLYLLKFSLDGELLEAHRLLGAMNEVDVIMLRLAPDGSGYINGYSNGNLTLSDDTIVPDSSNSLFLIHFDSSGQFAWHNKVSGYAPMACDAKGVVMGVNLEHGQSFQDSPPVEGSRAVALARWHRDGTLAWHRVLRSTSFFYCYSLALDPSGNVIAGFAADAAIDLGSMTLPTYPLPPESYVQGSMARFSPQGIPLDIMLIPTDFSTIAYGMDIDPKGRLLFVGQAGYYYPGTRTTKIQMGPFLQQYDGAGSIFYGITSPLGPALVTEQTSNQFKLNWSEYLSGFHLESSPSPLGPWNPVSTTTNSVTLDTSSTTGQFFRLKEQTE